MAQHGVRCEFTQIVTQALFGDAGQFRQLQFQSCSEPAGEPTPHCALVRFDQVQIRGGNSQRSGQGGLGYTQILASFTDFVTHRACSHDRHHPRGCQLFTKILQAKTINLQCGRFHIKQLLL